MVVKRLSWLLLPILLVSAAGASPLSPAAGVAGGAGGAELSQRDDDDPSTEEGWRRPGAGTIREALGGGVVEPAAAPPGPPGALRTSSRCSSPQECVGVGLCPQSSEAVLFSCAAGKVCCVPLESSAHRPRPSTPPVQERPQPQPQQQPQHQPQQPQQQPHINPQTHWASQTPRPQQPQKNPQTQQPQKNPQTQPASQTPRPQHPQHPQQQQKPQPQQHAATTAHPWHAASQPAQEQHTTRMTSKPPTTARPPPPAHPLLPKECGTSSFENRVINGKNAGLYQLPWMVLLGYGRRGVANVTFLCGGTLINNRYVLTAAHCFTPQSRPSIVRVGEYNLTQAPDCNVNECAPLHEDIAVESIVIHPEFDVGNIRNDIALIRLQRPIANFTVSVRPICLPLEINVEDDSNFRIAGWGKRDINDVAGSAVLQLTSVSGVGHAECNELQPPELQPLEPGQMCAGGDKGKDACKGDSGGPLMATQTKGVEIVTYQVGIVSYGPDSPCGTVPLPSIYTRVAFYTPWILANIKP